MRFLWNKIGCHYSREEWFCMKLALIVLWVPLIVSTLTKYDSAPLSVGICKVFPCDIFIHNGVSDFFILTTLVVAVLYLLEWKTRWLTIIMFLISLLTFSVEESNGVLERRGLLTFIFFAQFLAYSFSRRKTSKHLAQNRVQFSIQIIAVGYTLSAFSKLYNSGIYWVIDGKNMALQILKSFHYQYIDLGNAEYLREANIMVGAFGKNENLIYIALACTLIIEAFALISILNKKTAFVYGTLLLLMHAGIAHVMAINITAIVYPMIIFMLNPIYLAVKFLLSAFKYATNRPFERKTDAFN